MLHFLQPSKSSFIRATTCAICLCLASLAHAQSSGDPIEIDTLTILANTLADKDPGEGISQDELVAAVTNLLGTDEPYVDLASSDPALAGGYAGGRFSNMAGATIFISLNPSQESTLVTHSDSSEVSLASGNMAISFSGFSRDIYVSVYDAGLIFDGGRGSLSAPMTSFASTSEAPEEFNWAITGINTGTIEGVVQFSGAHSLIGSPNSDTFVLEHEEGTSNTPSGSGLSIRSAGEIFVHRWDSEENLFLSVGEDPSLNTDCDSNPNDVTISSPTNNSAILSFESGCSIHFFNNTTISAGSIDLSNTDTNSFVINDEGQTIEGTISGFNTDSDQSGGGSSSGFIFLSLGLLCILRRHKQNRLCRRNLCQH